MKKVEFCVYSLIGMALGLLCIGDGWGFLIIFAIAYAIAQAETGR